MSKMENFEKFYNIALRFLSYRPRSEKEVKDYLVRHSGEKRKRRLQNLQATERNARDSGHGLASAEASAKESQNDDRESIIEKVIAKLKVQKFLNDEEFVEWWIEQRTTFKPRSLRLIKIELKQKGISDELIESGIRQLVDQKLGIKNDLEQAKKLIEKRIERFRNLTKQETYQKLGRFLASKGFDWETIKQSIDEVVLKRV